MSDCSGAREQSDQGGASEQVSGASKQANGRASGSVLTSGFLFFLDHSASVFTAFTCTMVQNSQESRCKYWPTCPSIHSFACTTHSFAYSALLALPGCSAACSLAHSLLFMMPGFHRVLTHSIMTIMSCHLIFMVV